MIIFTIRHATSASEEAEAIEEVRAALSENGKFATMAYVDRTENQVYTCFLTSQTELAKQLVSKYNQDFYLEKGEHGFWYLIGTYTDQVHKVFKSLGAIEPEKAKTKDSFFTFNGEYYATEEYKF